MVGALLLLTLRTLKSLPPLTLTGMIVMPRFPCMGHWAHGAKATPLPLLCMFCHIFCYPSTKKSKDMAYIGLQRPKSHDESAHGENETRHFLA